MKLNVPYEKINPLSPDGVRDDQLISLAVGTLALGVQPIPNGDRTYVEYSADNDKIPLTVLDILSSKGVIIKNLPLFIEITSKTDACPFIEGTWEDWKLSNHTFYEADNRIFVGTNAHTNEDMDWADLQVVRSQLRLANELPQITE